MAAHFLGSNDPYKNIPFEFSEGSEWIIGSSSEEADIILQGEGVSPRHALVTKTEEGYYIKNLSPSDPLLVNNHAIKSSHLLKNQDQVTIGSLTFTFVEEEEKKKEKPKKTSGFDDVFDTIFEDLEETPKILDHEEEPEEEETIPEPPKEDEKYQRTAYDTIFEDSDSYEELPFNLLSDAPLLLKVISGPNSGAEIGVQKGQSYTIGKDPNTCDIVFQDMSVSRNHAKLHVDNDGKAVIEDLGSKNGILINGSSVEKEQEITTSDLVQLGTTIFLLIDRDAIAETIYSPSLAKYEVEEEKEEEIEPEVAAKVEPVKEAIPWKKQVIPTKHLVFAGSFFLIFFVIFLSFFSLFKSENIEITQKNESERIHDALDKFPDIQYSFNPGSGKAFLTGHVLSTTDFEELKYRLGLLDFLDSVENNVIIDDQVTRNVTDIINENGGFRGVTVYAPQAGKYVVSGYLQTQNQLQELQDYLNLNFPYLDRLSYQVVVENNLNTEISGIILASGFGSVAAQLSNGEIILSGRYPEGEKRQFMHLIRTLQKLEGVREVKSFAVASSASAAAIDITNNYAVTGYSRMDNKNYSVVLNGRIVTLGEQIDGMKVTNISSDTILLEKEGLKYKIDYSAQ